MTKHALSSQLVDDMVRFLGSGGTMLIESRNTDISPFLSTSSLRQIATKQRTATYSRLLRYMRQQNLITYLPASRSRIRIRLAADGMRRAQKITLAEMTIPKPPKWDQHWRIVFFDIPEAKRQARNNLVAKLKELGFHQLQKSAWIHPFPCLIEIEFIKRSFDLGSYVSLAEIDKIDRHAQLTRHFRSLLA